MANEIYELIYEVVREIPEGCVATYGQVAALAGLEGYARQVGYALSNLEGDEGVPWHRVINAKGEISSRWDPELENEQMGLLQDEGIAFNDAGKIVLKQYQWSPEEE